MKSQEQLKKVWECTETFPTEKERTHRRWVLKSRKELIQNMEDFIAISLLCGAACVHFYKQGLREGAERCIMALHREKIIAYDDTGEIYPNPFFKKI